MSRRSSTGSKERGAARAKPAGGGTRILHLDAFSGIAGNMFLGALLDLGLSRRELEADLALLDLPFKLIVKRVRRGALDACWVDVVPPPTTLREAQRRARAERRKAERAHAHAHAHGIPHEHHHRHDDHLAHLHDGAHDYEGGRSWREIQRILGRAKLPAPVRDRALAIFTGLAEAEARVHGIPVEEVHFHEVGAVDAIVDITGAAIGLHRLGVQRVTCSPLPLGHGTIGTAHGRLPLPAPATVELLRGVPVVPAGIEWETVTPTGAAIVRSVAEDFCALPAMRVEAIGHGAGNDRSGGLPNVLRAMLGEADAWSGDRVAVLETHLDDLNPEHFEYLMERLFETGALDVALMHLQMKKNRPGFAVRVVCRPSERAALAAVLFAESTTLGVRVAEMDRVVLERSAEAVDTPFGVIRVKFARDASGRLVPSAEYDDCKAAARRSGAPLREVVRAAEDAARTRGVATPERGGTRAKRASRAVNRRPR